MKKTEQKSGYFSVSLSYESDDGRHGFATGSASVPVEIQDMDSAVEWAHEWRKHNALPDVNRMVVSHITEGCMIDGGKIPSRTIHL